MKFNDLSGAQVLGGAIVLAGALVGSAVLLRGTPKQPPRVEVRTIAVPMEVAADQPVQQPWQSDLDKDLAASDARWREAQRQEELSLLRYNQSVQEAKSAELEAELESERLRHRD